MPLRFRCSRQTHSNRITEDLGKLLQAPSLGLGIDEIDHCDSYDCQTNEHLSRVSIENGEKRVYVPRKYLHPMVAMAVAPGVT